MKLSVGDVDLMLSNLTQVCHLQRSQLSCIPEVKCTFCCVEIQGMKGSVQYACDILCEGLTKKFKSLDIL